MKLSPDSTEYSTENSTLLRVSEEVERPKLAGGTYIGKRGRSGILNCWKHRTESLILEHDRRAQHEGRSTHRVLKKEMIIFGKPPSPKKTSELMMKKKELQKVRERSFLYPFDLARPSQTWPLHFLAVDSASPTKREGTGWCGRGSERRMVMSCWIEREGGPGHATNIPRAS
jgi:hypothetical protein